MRVALVHDHLAQDGGAEKVLKANSDLFPKAPIYTLLYVEENAAKYFKDKKIQTSIIQRMPGGIKHYQWYMPFMPMAVEFFDLRNFNVVVSDASAFAKGVITSPETLHICYCHTPTRYLWDYTHQYINELKYNKYFKKIISLVLNNVRVWDRAAADRVDVFIANSKTVQARIAKYYRRESKVIYPPVELDLFSPSAKIEDYFLIGGRLAPYKRVDIVIEAFVRIGHNLKIFGSGVDMKRLKKIANGAKNIEFLGRVSDEEKARLYRRAKAFLNPQVEDFGITVIESMASGRPVIAYNQGGATETIEEGRTGTFFAEQTPEAIFNAVRRFDEHNYDPQVIRREAMKYSTDRFKTEIKNFINNEYEKFKNKN